jgi:hypothetical protein
MTERRPAFDYSAFKNAFERKDAATWAEFIREDAAVGRVQALGPPRDRSA